MCADKGQMISKGHLVSSNFPKVPIIWPLVQLEIPQIPHSLFDPYVQIGQLFGIFLKKKNCNLSPALKSFWWYGISCSFSLNFDKFFRRILWRIFFDELLRRTFSTNFFKKKFMIIFSTIYFDVFFVEFWRIFNHCIGSLRIGVHLILFFKVAVSNLAVVKLVLVENLSDANSLT